MGEEVEVAAADATGGHADPGPPGTGELGLGQIDERCWKAGVCHVELDGAHRVSVGVFGDPGRRVRIGVPTLSR